MPARCRLAKACTVRTPTTALTPPVFNSAVYLSPSVHLSSAVHLAVARTVALAAAAVDTCLRTVSTPPPCPCHHHYLPLHPLVGQPARTTPAPQTCPFTAHPSRQPPHATVSFTPTCQTV
ncbi:hypothetical protein BKA70DRAFT_1423347 [Coprinopsis sp. MPI-PUGE-AT-0042]|nr:hypothetical protein BKA70DRAFT_1423347 [Coprinopsis sp. MPI-PUGE-AT-0042]